MKFPFNITQSKFKFSQITPFEIPAATVQYGRYNWALLSRTWGYYTLLMKCVFKEIIKNHNNTLIVCADGKEQ